MTSPFPPDGPVAWTGRDDLADVTVPILADDAFHEQALAHDALFCDQALADDALVAIADLMLSIWGPLARSARSDE
ncbi:hypothetical protein [Streptomyces sp. NPDC058291]|uniref:hypothetical protein n=1 Tax=Streptomyces sp. NPDC058291 TaxID=3346427 RepID=UPI0036EAA38B